MVAPPGLSRDPQGVSPPSTVCDREFLVYICGHMLCVSPSLLIPPTIGKHEVFAKQYYRRGGYSHKEGNLGAPP